MSFEVCTHTHPYYTDCAADWEKWRLVYRGGRAFVDQYLEQYSKREDVEDFKSRKKLTCCPSFAKAAVNDIKNAIFQRLVDISREGGSNSYMEAMKGVDLGVDLLGSSMNSFVGRKILPELLTISRVGAYVDMPPLYGDTLADQVGKRPYICEYHAEDIRSWSYDDGPNSDEFSTLLLRDHYYEYDPVFGLPTECKTRYRYLWKENGKVYVEFYDEKGELASETIELDVPMIPFVLWEISGSLLEDAGDYQVALLNMNSSDINFSVKANFAFYTEQYDPRSESPHLMPVGLDNPGEANGKGSVKEVRVGVAEGRRYPVGLERPDFVNPSPEPLRASMDKQEQMKREIRQLINLAVTNLEPTTPASAESKEFDEHSLESGLSYIGLELENGERKIAKFWAMYEGNKPATVNYPENYSLESTEVRISRGEKLQDLMLKIPSATYQKAVAKNIAKITVGPKISTEDMDKIESEIDGAPNMTSDPDTIKSDIEVGILSLGLASKLRGYPEGEVEKAKKDHEDRITRIALAQAEAAGAARGVPDASSNPAAGGKAEKEKSRDTTEDGKVSDKTRGEGK